MTITIKSLEEAISQFTQGMIAKGFQKEALHEYKDLKGTILYWRIRLKNPITGKKWIRPISWVEDKGYLLA